MDFDNDRGDDKRAAKRRDADTLDHLPGKLFQRSTLTIGIATDALACCIRRFRELGQQCAILRLVLCFRHKLSFGSVSFFVCYRLLCKFVHFESVLSIQKLAITHQHIVDLTNSL